MIVFAFPPQAAQENAPYYLSGTDYDTKTAAGTLVVVPPGCTPPGQKVWHSWMSAMMPKNKSTAR